ncbi:MAG: sensor histidine kinase, partial [Phormidium sp.]
MNETETLQALQKTNRVLKKQLERSISDRQRLELANRQREALLKESIRASQQQAKQLEAAMQELTRTQAQIVHSEKMSSLGQLVAGVAHEIN